MPSIQLKIKSRIDLWRLVRSVNTKEFDRIFSKYKDDTEALGYSKYLNIKKWMLKSLWHAYILDLHKGIPLNILDIGSGAGYFPFICNYFGHTATAIDLEDNNMYNELIPLLKVKRVIHRVEAFQNLPTFENKFDLITAYMMCFNGHRTENVWGIKEWDNFISNLAMNYTTPDARIFLTFNPEPNGELYTQELKDFFLSKDAIVEGERVYFKKLSNFRNV